MATEILGFSKFFKDGAVLRVASANRDHLFVSRLKTQLADEPIKLIDSLLMQSQHGMTASETPE